MVNQAEQERLPRHWALMANPGVYRIEEAVRELEVDPWTTAGKELRPGDHVVIWKAKCRDEHRGIVALGEVITEPYLSGDRANTYWVDGVELPEGAEVVDIRYMVPPGAPMWLTSETKDVIGDLNVARARGGTVFHVTEEEWRRVVDALGGIPEDSAEARLSRYEPFSPESVEDGREKMLRAVACRRGQSSFRKALMEAYGGVCAVTGCHVAAILEAAHIYPYQDDGRTNEVSNGLLLRSDIHTLFDLGLLGVTEEYQVVVNSQLEGSAYADLHGRRIRLPKTKESKPSKEALQWKLNKASFVRA